MKTPSIMLLLVFMAAFGAVLEAEEINIPLSELSLAELMNIKISTVGSGFQENNLDAASSIEVIETSDWQATGARNYWDAIGHIPGMLVTTSLLSSEALVYRGISIAPGTHTTAMIIDGVPVNSLLHSTGFYHLNNIGLTTLSRIEMIQGPGSALYGADALQGVLSLQTKITDNTHTRFESAIGHEAYYQYAASFGRQLSENLTTGLAYEYSKSLPNKVIFFDANGGKFSAERDTRYALDMPKKAETLTAFMNYSPNARLTLHNSFLLNKTSELVNRFHSNRPLHNFLEGEFYLAQSKLEYQLSNQLQLEGQVYYWQGGITWDFFQHDPITQQNFNTVNRFDAKDHRYGADFRIKANSQGQRLRWQLGLSVSTTEADKFTRGLVTNPPIEQGSTGHRRDLNSIYGEIRAAILKHRLDIVAGARLDNYSDFGQQFSPKLGLIYRLSEISRLKLLYGYAFRAPSASEIAVEPAPGVGGAFGNRNLKPETIDTYELIYMKNWPAQYIELIAFYNRITDGILQDGLPTNDPRANLDPEINAKQTVRTNGADSHSYGMVFKHGRSFNQWRIDTNLTYAKGKNTTADYAYDSYPTWIGNISISYLWRSDFKISLINRVAYDRTTFQSRNTTDNPTKTADYYRTDLNINSPIGNNWQISFDVRNLLNKKNLHQASYQGETLKPEQGLSGWLTARYTFN
ncbi:MAG: TonB-dependent receptor [Pseudomonadales bacterium]|nr:TonB-dependent receptor [Pseudomonadales bacterium]